MHVIRRSTEVQGAGSWTPPTGTLGQIIAETAERVQLLHDRERELGRLASQRGPALSFRAALDRSDVAVIAEVKRRSPSKGWINTQIDVAEQAKAYATGGAAAISVLTEHKHFDGSSADLELVSRGADIPLLKKDFHVSTIQLLEARALGASAALLIARALPPEDLPRLIKDAERLGLEVLVEVRDENELQRAIDAGASIIGVNNRNLETLEIDPGTSERLIPRIPAGIMAIAESGIAGRGDVERVARAGANAVLVGSSISAAPEPRAAVAALVGVPRGRQRD
jgi:indole-3-glycerol phosphate synthase